MAYCQHTVRTLFSYHFIKNLFAFVFRKCISFFLCFRTEILVFFRSINRDWITCGGIHCHKRQCPHWLCQRHFRLYTLHFQIDILIIIRIRITLLHDSNRKIQRIRRIENVFCKKAIDSLTDCTFSVQYIGIPTSDKHHLHLNLLILLKFFNLILLPVCHIIFSFFIFYLL